MEECVTRFGRRVFATKRVFARCHEMAYGVATACNGEQVMFNRFYEPIWRRPHDRAPALAATPDSMAIQGVYAFCYDDGHAEVEKVRRAAAVMTEWGLQSPVAPRRRRASA